MSANALENKFKTASSQDMLDFVHLLEAARASNLSLPKALSELAARSPDGVVREWAEKLSELTACGNSLAESASSLECLDPALAALLALPGGAGMQYVLSAYAEYLVLFDRLAQQMRAVTLYPLIMMWLALANIAILNLYLFPAMHGIFESQHLEMPIVVRLFSFCNPATLPLSLLLPLLVTALAVAGTQMWLFVPPNEIPHSTIGKLFALSKIAVLERNARLQYLIALFLRAGCRLTDAVRFAANLLLPDTATAHLLTLAERLESGEDLSIAAQNDLLAPIASCFKDPKSADAAPRILESASSLNIVNVKMFLNRFEKFAFSAALLFVAIIVLLLTICFFDPYFTLIGALK